MYSGFDENLVHTMLSGGNGCIGGLSNIAPEVCAAWVKAINDKDLEMIEVFQKKINALMAFYAVEQPFLPAMKHAMILRGLPLDAHCIEFAAVTPNQVEKVKDILSMIE